MAATTMAQAPAAAIIGIGLIGRAWAIVFARAGWSVNLYARDHAKYGAAIDAIGVTLDDMEAAGLLSEQPATILTRIKACNSLLEACRLATLVLENAAENEEVKKQLFAELDTASPPTAVIASSTSWIPSSRFTADVPGRHRCLVAHPTNPPNLVPLVELCPAPWTSEETVRLAMNLFSEVGQEPVLVNREIDGFLLNRIQGAVLNEVLNLFEGGYANTADLDKVLKHGLGLRWSFMGPFETIDLNAPHGVVDYAQRYGHTYADLAKSQSPNQWTPELIARIEAERRKVLSEEDLAVRARWRDIRLMALLGHKNLQVE